MRKGLRIEWCNGEMRMMEWKMVTECRKIKKTGNRKSGNDGNNETRPRGH